VALREKHWGRMAVCVIKIAHGKNSGLKVLMCRMK
jgi:hypothetical protein